MTSSAPEPLAADEPLVRAHAARLADLAKRHGIYELRFASAGRLVGRVDDNRDLLDVAAFEVEAEQLLGATVQLLSGAVVNKPNVSEDLIHAALL